MIEKQIREHLNVQPGALAVQRLAGDHVEIYFLPSPHRRSLRGALAKHRRTSVSPEAWAEARDRAWQDDRGGND